MPKKLPFFAVMLLAVSSCSHFASSPKDSESGPIHTAEVESIALFNGETLDGWVVENGGQFSVVDGLLRVDRGVGWLRSEDEFEDFELEVVFRFLERDANSGVFVRTGATSKQDDNGWPDNGYQIQCRETTSGDYPIAALIPYGAPSFASTSDLDAIVRAYRPIGEWNRFDIVCVGETLTVSLNGIAVTTAESIKNRGGHVGIQGENGLLEFKTVRLKTLVNAE